MMDINLSECHSYVVALRVEHQHLRKTLQEILAALDDYCRSPELSGRVQQRLAELRLELEEHFSTEEAGGCLDEAKAYCPAVAGEVQRVLAEHPDLLNELDGVIRAVAASGSLPDEIRAAFAHLAERVHEHEEAENGLLTRAFGEAVE